jgi:hypothetical protein
MTSRRPELWLTLVHFTQYQDSKNGGLWGPPGVYRQVGGGQASTSATGDGAISPKKEYLVLITMPPRELRVNPCQG